MTLTTLTPTSFTHFIDLQGNVEANDVSNIAPRNGTGGVVRSVLIKQGDPVRKGQLLLKLDDAIQRQNLATDQWNFYEAKSLKKNLYALAADLPGPKSAEYAKVSAKNLAEQDGIQKQAKATGVDAKTCQYCHVDKLPKKDAGQHDPNDVGKWLIAEKDKRKAKQVDGAW